MSEEEATPNQRVAPPLPPSQASPTEADGPPKTPYGIAALLVAVIPAYSWLFKTWDESEFPETLTSPLYWIFLSILFFLAGLVAVLMRSSVLARLREVLARQRGWFDVTIIVGFLLICIVLVASAIYVGRETKPPPDKFTVVFFTFSGDNTTTQNAAASFQRFIKRKLERDYGNEVVCLSRERKIKGENYKEELAYAKKWALRKAGCHLAVWANVEMDEDGQHYVGNVHYLKASQFGSESKSDSIGVFSRSGEFTESFRMMPVGFAQSVDKEQIEEVVDAISLCWGLASYRKGDYDAALRVLPESSPNGEFFAGEAAVAKAEPAVESNRLYEDAEAHYQKAIQLNGYEKRKNQTVRIPNLNRELDLMAARYYRSLGDAYYDEEISGRAGDLKEEARKALSAYAKSAAIYKQFDEKEEHGTMLTDEAKSLLDLSSIDTGSTASADLNQATTLFKDALSALQANPRAYAHAEVELGRLYLVQNENQKAIEAEEHALPFYADDPLSRLGPLRFLGAAQTALGTILQNEGKSKEGEEKFKAGMASFEDSFEHCEGLSSHECSASHRSAGDALFKWALSWRRNSAPWSTSLERALKEYDLSAKYASLIEQSDRYIELKLRRAKVYTEQAIGEAQKQGQALIPLKAQRDDLKEGIDALQKANGKVDALRQELVQCCRRIAIYSAEDARKCLDLVKTNQQEVH